MEVSKVIWQRCLISFFLCIRITLEGRRLPMRLSAIRKASAISTDPRQDSEAVPMFLHECSDRHFAPKGPFKLG